MSSIIGSQLGSYQITALLGKGGMGEVYRANDLKLGRSVAVKLLPDLFAQDPERIRRFEREARMLAALSHPNIASIYGLETSGGRNFLVMELVEGETLEERIRRGRLPIEDALTIALQICEALGAAHEKNIIHRDLKPANIKITPEEKVKVLDFGLAKALEAPSSAVNLSNSPTLNVAATNAGMILGTAAYMSPEQAKGKDADIRSDVWSFGVVLFEMLTGKSAFAGETVIEVLGGVVKSDPDWNALPATLSPSVRQLLRRCLQKDPARRLRDIGEARFQIGEAIAAPAAIEVTAVVPTRKTFERLMWTAAIVLALAAGSVVSGPYIRSTMKSPQVESRFGIPVPDGTPSQMVSIAISPDGRNIVYGADAGGTPMLWIRPIDSLQPRPLPGTQNGTLPFWSPDSRFVGYTASGKLMKIDITGGPAQPITTKSGMSHGTWNANGMILFGHQGSIQKVSSAGGAATPALDPDPAVADTAHPSFLPDGDHFLFFGSGRQNPGIYIGSLTSKETKPLMAGDSMGLYAAGFILFLRDGTLMAQPFDARRLELTGDPTPVVERVATSIFRAGFAVSENGTLIYRPEIAITGRLNFLNRKGEKLESVAPPADYSGLSLSPDGKQVAVRRHEEAGGDIWIMDSSGGKTNKLTVDAKDAEKENASPVWSPDGSRIAFGAKRGSKWGLYEKSANGVGEEQLLLDSPVALAPMSWSGKFIAYTLTSPETGVDIWSLSLADSKATPVFNDKLSTRFPQISPDTRWIAYSSNQSGNNEIWVESFPPGRGKWQISTTGGFYARWSRDGKELLYFDSDGTTGQSNMFSVLINATGKSFDRSPASKLFEVKYIGGPSTGLIAHNLRFDVSRNGDRFLVSQRDVAAVLGEQPPSINVIMNWPATIQKR